MVVCFNDAAAKDVVKHKIKLLTNLQYLIVVQGLEMRYKV